MITMTKSVVAEALFVSDLQPSQRPSARLVQVTVDQMIQQYGAEGCAARMAAEFGEHPDLAVRRMLWVRRLMNGGSPAEWPSM